MYDLANLFHIGIRTPDIETSMEELASGTSPENGFGRFTYLRSPTGFLIEPVSIAAKPRFERWWAGGPLRDPGPPPV